MPGKVSIVGAGNVGASCAQRIAERNHADVVLVDVVPGLPQGKALDILESAPLLGFDVRLIGANDYQETAGSEIVIITAGLPRRPGMTRDQLLQTNTEIVAEVTRNIVSRSPKCIIIMVTNPLEAMTHLAIQISRFPRNRVIGLSGVLDAARFSSFIAAELKVSPKDVSTCVIGSHGKNMVVIPRLTSVKGKPLTKILPPETIGKLVERTVEGGGEIVRLLKTGSAFYAPSAAATRMAEAMLLDKKEILPCAAYLKGEYGINDTVIGVPVKLGRNGIEQIIELELTKEERQALVDSAKGVQDLVRTMKSG